MRVKNLALYRLKILQGLDCSVQHLEGERIEAVSIQLINSYQIVNLVDSYINLSSNLNSPIT